MASLRDAMSAKFRERDSHLRFRVPFQNFHDLFSRKSDLSGPVFFFFSLKIPQSEKRAFFKSLKKLIFFYFREKIFAALDFRVKKIKKINVC